MLRFACPFCHFQNSVPESDAGGRITCPACGATVAVPATRFDNGCIIGDFIIQGKIGAGSGGLEHGESGGPLLSTPELTNEPREWNPSLEQLVSNFSSI